MATALGNPVAGPEDVEGRRQAALRRAVKERQKQALNLQRENILSQKTSNPARRSALASALAQIEAQIHALG